MSQFTSPVNQKCCIVRISMPKTSWWTGYRKMRQFCLRRRDATRRDVRSSIRPPPPTSRARRATGARKGSGERVRASGGLAGEQSVDPFDAIAERAGARRHTLDVVVIPSRVVVDIRASGDRNIAYRDFASFSLRWRGRGLQAGPVCLPPGLERQEARRFPRHASTKGERVLRQSSNRDAPARNRCTVGFLALQDFFCRRRSTACQGSCDCIGRGTS